MLTSTSPRLAPLRLIQNLVSVSSKSTSYPFLRHQPKHKLLVQMSLASCNTLYTFNLSTAREECKCIFYSGKVRKESN
jgi:hypothetical protein